MSAIHITVLKSFSVGGKIVSAGETVAVLAVHADWAVTNGYAEFLSARDRARTNTEIPSPDTKACPFIRELRRERFTT